MTGTERKGGWRPAAALAWGRRRVAARATPPWRAWVEALLGRYLRRPVRRGGPARVLARPLTRVRERWLLASRTLLPQIRLAIQPLLRPRLRPTPPAPPAPATPGRDRELRGERTVLERRLAGSPPPAAAHAPAPGVLARSREPGSPRPLPAGADSTRRPPLQLVFQRLREPERALAAGSPARREERSAAPAALARRLAGRARRVEQAPAAARVVARREAPPASGAAAARWEASAASPRWDAPRTRQISAPQPAVDVAALAHLVVHQIDDRLHAWRERTGF